MHSLSKYLDEWNRSEFFLIASLFVILIISSLMPFCNIIFTTNDDFRNFMNTFAPDPLAYAIETGRFQYIYQMCIIRLPYLLKSFNALVVIRNLSHILLILFICYTVYRATFSLNISLLSFLLFFAWLQNSDTHNLITAYPFVFHFTLISILLSFMVFERFSEKPSFIMGILVFLFILYGISVYESFIALVLFSFWFDRSTRTTLNQKLLIYSPYYLSVIVVICMHVLWKCLFPSIYENVIVNISLNDILPALNVIYQYTISALPSYFYFHNSLSKYSVWTILNYSDGYLYIKCICVFLISVYFFIVRPHENENSHSNIIFPVAMLICMAFTMNGLYGLTSKYRHWVMAGSPAYVATFFSFLLFTIAVAMILARTSALLHKRSSFITRLIAGGILALLISLLSLLTGISNHSVNKEEERMTARLRLMDSFMRSEFFTQINDGDIIFAPSLMESVPQHLSKDWSDYIAMRTDKRIRVKKKWPLAEGSAKGRRVFMNFISTDDDPLHAVMIASDLMAGSGDSLLTKSFNVYSCVPGPLNILGSSINFGQDSGDLQIASRKLNHFSYNQNFFSVQLTHHGDLNDPVYEMLSNKPIDPRSIQVTRNVTPVQFFSRLVPRTPFKIHFQKDNNNSLFFIESGFETPEDWGTWSCEREAKVSFQLRDPIQKGLHMKIRFNAFVAPNYSQWIEMLLNGHLLSSGEYKDTGIHELIFDISKIVTNQNTLLIKVPHATSPAALKISEDPRKLGIGVISLEFVTLPAEDSRTW